MNLTTIDDFLYQKTLSTLKSYFKYLQKGFKIIDIEKKEIPKDNEHLIIKHFGKDVIAYQVASTSFVSEIFHIVETFLKSNLFRSGEYLIYPSIDKYPDNKEKLDNYNKVQREKIKQIMVDHTKAFLNKNDDRLKALSKTLGETMFLEDKDILVNSITCSEALFRLEKYLNWTITDEAKERFKLFIENRNEIIHFNKLTNLTFACSHSMFVLVSLASSKSDLYPKFSSTIDYLNNYLNLYNVLIPEILFATETYKALEKVKDTAKDINKVFEAHFK